MERKKINLIIYLLLGVGCVGVGVDSVRNVRAISKPYLAELHKRSDEIYAKGLDIPILARVFRGKEIIAKTSDKPKKLK